MADPRPAALAPLHDAQPWDVLIIGGGASGLGCAVDAAARGYRTLLVERGDFACGTSSKSTKLIHGGVRYLRQGDFAMVRSALAERSRLLANAAALVQPQPFVIPARSHGELLRYAAGLKLYDLLAGKGNIAASAILGRDETLAALPGLRPQGVVGGIRYHDARFDDARLAIALMRTATALGAVCCNYVGAIGLIKEAGRISGARLRDQESDACFDVRARVVVNASGVHADEVRRFDDARSPSLLAVSQGIHLVVDREFLPGESALLVPETDDGRVAFAIPWQGKLLLGTTDTPREDRPLQPLPLSGEVEFVLRTAGRLLIHPPGPDDVRSVFAGLRPLLDPAHGHRRAASLSREHAVVASPAGLVTVTGGKWTTYRRMAEEVIDRAAEAGGLPAVACPTRDLRLQDCSPAPAGGAGGGRLHADFPWTAEMVRSAIRDEMARTVEDVLARRLRACFVDAGAAAAMVEPVAGLLAEELGLDAAAREALRRQGERAVRRFLLGAGSEN